MLNPNGKNRQASALNNELYTGSYITRGDNKDITIWQEIRNKPAHGNYNKYTKERVDLVIKERSMFIKLNPA